MMHAKHYLYIFSLVLITLFSCQRENQISWDQAKLNEAKEFSEKIGTFAFILSTRDTLIAAWGDTITPTSLHSGRKSISSSIYAMYMGKGDGKLDLDKTLKELEIDDYPTPLTEGQKEAKVLHLIKSISGINHPAAAETEGMRTDKTRVLGTDPNVLGTKWAYNNWDYNTLITIFEKQTGLKEKDVFIEQIAVPLDMQDITDSTVLYHKDPTLSQHSSIEYNLSARDMLKFSQLCLHKGNWKGKQIIPQDYFDRITSDYVKTGVPGLRSGYGYMWWVPCDRVARKFGIPEGSFSADGMGSQRIIIIPAWETVIVHKANTNLRKGFLMWLSDSGYEESDSTFIKTNLDSLLIEFVNVIGIRCKEPDFTDNPICQECKMVSDEDFQALLKMIIDAKM